MMRGLISWMRSQVKPCRSSTPGPKFSTMTSHRPIISSSTFLPPGDFQVDRDAALVRVQHREIEAVGALHVAQLAARDVAAPGHLDLDDLGAHPGQELRRGRRRLDMPQIENAHAFQCLAHVSVPCSRCPVEKIAMRLDMRGEPQRVLARQPLGELRIAALQRLDDPQMVGDRTRRPVFLMDRDPADRPHVDEHVFRHIGEQRTAAHSDDRLVKGDVRIGVFVEPRAPYRRGHCRSGTRPSGGAIRRYRHRRRARRRAAPPCFRAPP